jgi:uncharacterized phage infection (PIP) family protein YhgE
MNAYELADELDKVQYQNGSKPFEMYATMLRQQQDEIDALKKFIAESNALDKKLHEFIKKSNEAWSNATKSILKKAKK